MSVGHTARGAPTFYTRKRVALMVGLQIASWLSPDTA